MPWAVILHLRPFMPRRIRLQAHRLLRPLCKNARSVSAIKNRILTSGRATPLAARNHIGAACRM